MWVFTSPYKAPFIWSQVSETALPRQLYQAFIWEKGVPASWVKVDSPWLLIKLFNIQIPIYLSSFEFLSFIRSVWALLSLFCFCNVNLCFKTWNFENPWHSARRALSRVGEQLLSVHIGKNVPPSRLSYLLRRDNAPTWVVSLPERTQGI